MSNNLRLYIRSLIKELTYIPYETRVREWYVDGKWYDVGDISHMEFAKKYFESHYINVDSLEGQDINTKFINDFNAIRFWDGVFEMKYKSNQSFNVIKQHLIDYKFPLNTKVYLDFLSDNTSYKETVEVILSAKTIRDLEEIS